MLLSRDPWLRSPGEDESAYAEFLMWLQAPRPRPAPHRPDLAATWAWGPRAAAHDTMGEHGARTPEQNLATIRKVGLALVALGLEKWYRAEVSTPETMRATLTEHMRVLATIERLGAIGGDLGGGDLEARLATMSPEEVDTLERAAKLMRVKGA